MNVLECLQAGLARVGLNTTNTDFQTQARFYLNSTLQQLTGEATWWWLHKSSTIQCTREFTLTSVTGTFSATDTITGVTSGATATVTAWDSTNKILTVKNETGAFTLTEEVKVDNSNKATLSSMASTKEYSLASDLSYPLSFRNRSQDYVISIIGNEDIDLRDPNQSQTGEPNGVVMIGLDSSGNQKVQLYPAPDDSNTIIDYRYYGYLSDYTSGDDSVDLTQKVPKILQPALYFGIAKLYKQEKGDFEGALVELAEYRQVVDRALNINRQNDGNRRYRMERRDRYPAFSFTPVDGTVGSA